LLSFSRIGRSEIHFSSIDMTRMARDVFEGLIANTTNNDHRITLLDLPNCLGDSTLIRQVWTNLISNAIKYSSKTKEPYISIGFEQNPEEIVYFVKDNGVGFEMEYVNKLFGVFQRLHNSADFEGTGVGLAIVQRIIQRHGGSVRAYGEVNSGASFYFSLPINPFQDE